MNATRAIETASAALRQGSLDEAEAALLEVIRKDPEAAGAYELLGEVYVKQQRLDLAVAVCSAAVSLDPDLRGAYRHLAQAHRGLGQTDEAMATLQSAIRHHPNEGAFYLDAAILLADGQRLETALELLSRARHECPGIVWQADLLQLHLLINEGRFDEVRKQANGLLRRTPDNIGALEYLAAACFHAGDHDGALEATRHLVARSPGVAEYELRLADLLRDTGHVGGCVEVLEHLLDSTDDEDARDAALEGLQAADEAQIPVILMMAMDSPRFRRELDRDAAETVIRHGFSLSRIGLATLLAALADHGADGLLRPTYH